MIKKNSEEMINGKFFEACVGSVDDCIAKTVRMPILSFPFRHYLQNQTTV